MKVLGKILRYCGLLLSSLCGCALIYCVVALLYDTEAEKALVRENRIYSEVLSDFAERGELVSDALAAIQYKDDDIYRHLFKSAAPRPEPQRASENFVFESDTIPDSDIARYTSDKSRALLLECAAVDSMFTVIFEHLASSDSLRPPMALPCRSIGYMQVGASRGLKVSPFYKTLRQHTGLDLVVPIGTGVYATADGTAFVPAPTRAGGRVVEIRHEGSYKTRYEHLEDIFIKTGDKVSAGELIATSGMSGNTTAPHLHYEVLLHSQAQEPVNYFFASVGPSEYTDMMYIASQTVQSMD